MLGFSIAICSLCSPGHYIVETALIESALSTESGQTNSLHNISTRVNQSKRLLQFRTDGSFLLSAIGHVIFWGSKKKMVWSDALGIVAFVTYKKYRIKRAIGNFIRYAVSKPLLAVSAAFLNNTIAASATFGTSPFPAFSAHGNFFPESFRYWSVWGCHRKMVAHYMQPCNQIIGG